MLTFKYCFVVVYFVCHSSLYYFCSDILFFCILASPSPRVNKLKKPTRSFSLLGAHYSEELSRFKDRNHGKVSAGCGEGHPS